MKKNILFTVFSLLALSFGFTSCDDDDADTTPPVIELNKPVEGAEVMVGKHICLDMDLSDNDELRSYKVDIHSAAGHTHDTKADMPKPGHGTKYSYNHTWDDIKGLKNTHVHTHDIVIPEDAELGEYHFMVYCTDKSGNETYVVRNIVLIANDGSEDDHHGHEHHEHGH